MKMHPKPMSRHTHHVEPVKHRLTYESAFEERGDPVHIQFTFPNGATQRLTMTRAEASKLISDLHDILRVSAG